MLGCCSAAIWSVQTDFTALAMSGAIAGMVKAMAEPAPRQSRPAAMRVFRFMSSLRFGHRRRREALQARAPSLAAWQGNGGGKGVFPLFAGAPLKKPPLFPVPPPPPG